MCNLGAGCKNDAEFLVTRKAVAKRPVSQLTACLHCASKIGALLPTGAIINTASKENMFYKIEALV